MINYKIDYDDSGKPSGIRRSDGASIPIDTKNRDFRKFLEWNKKENLDFESQKKLSKKTKRISDVEKIDALWEKVINGNNIPSESIKDKLSK